MNDIGSPASAPSDYIRGARGGLNRAAAILLAISISALVLITLTTVFTIAAINENARHDQLHNHGVAVQITVTGCVALASGTGITEAGFRCQGSFTLNGQHYTSGVNGTDSLYEVGQTLAAVVDPHDPSNLTTRAVAARNQPDWPAFVPASITFLLLAVLVTACLWLRARSRIGRLPS